MGPHWRMPRPTFALIAMDLRHDRGRMSALAGTWAYGWLRPRLPHCLRLALNL